MARPKNEHLHQQRRAEILLAAARTFKRKGFHLTRTDDICEAAGLSAGTVFRYFRSKQEMIMAIAVMEFERHKEQVLSMANREGLTWLSRITAVELESLFAPSEYDLGTDSWLELSRSSEWRAELHLHDHELRAALAKELARGRDEGWVARSVDPEGATTLIFALFNGLSFDRETGTELAPETTAKAIADFFGRFILA